MADGTVNINDGSGTPKKIDNELVTVGGQSVYRQRVVASSALAFKVADGKAFSAGSAQSVAAGSTGTWSLANPAGSGKVVYIVGAQAWNDSTTILPVTFHKDSTITGGTTLTPWNPNMASAATSVAEVKYGVGIRSGGTALDVTAQLVRDEPWSPADLFVIVPPGSSIQFSVAVGGALSSQNVRVGARWYEE